MILVNAAVGIIQLIIAVVLAVVALYIGFSVFGKITKGIDPKLISRLLLCHGEVLSIISLR